ncbi:MAG TPA: sensor histidine kinase, partial [Roseateles sp.]
EQALTNLIENARTASGSAVHVDAERDADGLRLHVCDNGPGVPDAIRERLFEPFASRSPGGTGLGLAIVARVMAAHGGTAALTERPGWRTCFTLSFPHEPFNA